jgi:hypothetical protein
MREVALIPGILHVIYCLPSMALLAWHSAQNGVTMAESGQFISKALQPPRYGGVPD